jgi:hypothetical protein
MHAPHFTHDSALMFGLALFCTGLGALIVLMAFLWH